MKVFLVVAAVYGLLVFALRARWPAAGRRGPDGRRQPVGTRVRLFVDRVNLLVILAMVATAIYVVVTRVLWDL